MGYTTDEELEKFTSEIDEREVNTTTASDTQTEEEFETKSKKCKSLHKCTYAGCNKSFWKPSRLKWHLRQHTGEVYKSKKIIFNALQIFFKHINY